GPCLVERDHVDNAALGIDAGSEIDRDPRCDLAEAERSSKPEEPRIRHRDPYFAAGITSLTDATFLSSRVSASPVRSYFLSTITTACREITRFALDSLARSSMIATSCSRTFWILSSKA